ncbi:hypothetical protein K8352_12750 [Flavobacteriaceae bacterium F89]|uniref:Uncharacterized protein n=1 Tax=Cerina litoralis TaxID=2874477 RepID=A0AAE3EV64_9FLAO|nr:hypothetical protein [Cerina litoralis]MCG2461622.1 hypothetical protein [Cerina litoralis]
MDKVRTKPQSIKGMDFWVAKPIWPLIAEELGKRYSRSIEMSAGILSKSDIIPYEK